MAVRQRFKPAEREAFKPGTRVEWLNGSHWQPAEITGPMKHCEITGRPYYPMVHKGKTTRTISHGATLTGSPGRVRLPLNVA